MTTRALGTAAVGLLLATMSFAKDKPKVTMPPYVLHAHTVAVIIDPAAGESLSDPEENRVAQQDVEVALRNWGRFEPMVVGQQIADLIIIVRRGHGKLVDETVGDPRQGNRPVAVNPSETGIDVGVQHGRAPGGVSASDGAAAPPPRPRSQVGEPNDSFVVYEAGEGVENPLDAPPAWRYEAKDGLRPHTVPAVAAFRKAVAEAEKAAAKQP